MSLTTGVEPCARVKSTLLVGSMQALRSRGHGEAYLKHIDRRVAEAISAVGVPQWLPIEVAEVHLRSVRCDRADRRRGPKDATIDIRGNSLARYAYWRTGLRGIIVELARALSTTAYAREVFARAVVHDAVTYTLSWV
jgi:hypothetical protein